MWSLSDSVLCATFDKKPKKQTLTPLRSFTQVEEYKSLIKHSLFPPPPSRTNYRHIQYLCCFLFPADGEAPALTTGWHLYYHTLSCCSQHTIIKIPEWLGRQDTPG